MAAGGDGTTLALLFGQGTYGEDRRGDHSCIGIQKPVGKLNPHGWPYVYVRVSTKPGFDGNQAIKLSLNSRASVFLKQPCSADSVLTGCDV